MGVQRSHFFLTIPFIIFLLSGCERSQPPTSGAAPQAQLTMAAVKAANLQQILSTLHSPDQAREAATSDEIRFAWLLFTFVNWPALTTERGKPNPNIPFGTPGTVVWQTWKTSQDLYVAPGQTPLPWNQGPIVEPPALQAREIDGKVLTDNNGNPVMYEVRLNEDTFNYILGRNLYTQAGQLQLLSGGQPVQFPQPALEIKASWRFLGNGDDPTHYLTTTVQYNGQQKTVGLSGLHITSKALPQWFWCTFEQIENPKTTPITLKLPIAPEVQVFNQAVQKAAAGTMWAYYQLNGMQTQFVTNPYAAPCIENSKATCLANTQIETYFQGSSSCITCHSLASIGPGGSRHSFFNFSGGNQQGYMGNPPVMKKDIPLDFVWSMREAQ